MPASEFPISIRFTGPRFKTSGVPIQDLGETLITIQRMVYKTYFIQQKHSFKKAVPSDAERKLLALEIGERKRGSDIYQFIWQALQLMDSIPIDFTDLVTQLTASMIIVNSGRIWDVVSRPRKRPTDLLAIALYNEMEELADRVGKAGGIQRIEITMEGSRRPIIIDASTKAEIKNAKRDAKISKTRQRLEGDVIAPHTIGEDYATVRVGMERIKVHLKTKTLFRKMMHELDERPTARLAFSGFPRLMIDFSPDRFVEFFADKVGPVNSA